MQTTFKTLPSATNLLGASGRKQATSKKGNAVLTKQEKLNTPVTVFRVLRGGRKKSKKNSSKHGWEEEKENLNTNNIIIAEYLFFVYPGQLPDACAPWFQLAAI